MRSVVSQDGSSPVTVVFGSAMFLFFLLLASQVLLHLYATSIVTSATFATASQVAADGSDCGPGGATAERIARDRLGSFGHRHGVRVMCDPGDGETTSVTITAPSPAQGLALLRSSLNLDVIQRTSTVRTERLR